MRRWVGAGGGGGVDTTFAGGCSTPGKHDADAVYNAGDVFEAAVRETPAPHHRIAGIVTYSLHFLVIAASL